MDVVFHCTRHPRATATHFCMGCQTHLCKDCIRPADDGSGAMLCNVCAGQVISLDPADQPKRKTPRKKTHERPPSILGMASGILTAPRATLRNLPFDLFEYHRTLHALLFVILALILGSTIRMLAIPAGPDAPPLDAGFWTGVAIHVGIRLLGLLLAAVILNVGAVLTGEGAAFLSLFVTIAFLTASLELVAAPVLSLLQNFQMPEILKGARFAFEIWNVVLLYVALSEVYACDFISALLIGVVGRGVTIIAMLSAWSWIETLLSRFGS